MTQPAILIADDEDLIRRVLMDTLSEEGYIVETVSSGKLAWERLQAQTFALAFVDIRMPELNGLDLLLRLQETQLTTPIIIMTGQTTLTNAVEAMKRGAFDYLPKPFDLEEVKALAARACEAQQLTAEDSAP